MAEQHLDTDTTPELPTSRAPGYVIGAIFLLAGITLVVGSFGFPEAVGRSDPGPAFLPLVAGVGLIVCALAHLLRVPAPATADEQFPDRGALGRIAVAFVTMVAYAYLLRELGFILTTTLFMLVTLWLANARKPLLLVLLPLLIAVGLHFIFAETLHVPLPRGLVEGWLP
ncbi:tripartite tricarboxylate transporter TctB family protein [Ornithinimicrobium faecis]|uniref:tripartite tricarboxylate transporter TctB family protein n=1 Tax=Ornithinimicrobium faecis TaxID=2934158 RepID=UPI0021172EA4|nr:tripartite tricarboxylate transporter TctB family protein [Ornithinimicrobium sp. HY1745]